MLNVHAGAAACVTLNVLPAIVSVPVRGVCAVLASTRVAHRAVAAAAAPDVTCSQVALGAAVHAQPAFAVTATLPVPPAATTL